MAFSALITLTIAGSDTGPFDLYSNVDGYTGAFATSVSKFSLLSGYVSNNIPNGTTIIRVKSISTYCTNYVDLGVSTTTTTTIPTTTTTTTVAVTTTTTTTAAPTTTTTTTAGDPATATLTFTDYQSGKFYFDLSHAIPSTNVTVSAANANGSDNTGCTPFNESDDLSAGDLIITAGHTSGNKLGASPMTCGTLSWRRGTFVTVNGLSKSNGQTLTIGGTLVTVVIPSTCVTPYAC